MSRRARLALLVALLLGITPGWPSLAIPSPVAAQATPCAGLDTPAAGTSLALLACGLGGPTGAPPAMILRLSRQRFAPDEAVSPQVAINDELLFVEEGELVIAEVPYTAGESRFISANDSYGLRNDSFAEASLLTLRLIRIAAAMGSFSEDPPRVGSAPSPSEILSQWTAPPSGTPALFLAEMTLAPGAAIGPISHPGPVGLLVESGALSIEHYASGFAPGVPYAGQRELIARDQQIFLARHTTYRAWNDSGVTVKVLLAGALAADRPPIEQSPGTIAFAAKRGGQWDLLAYDFGSATLTTLAGDPGSNELAPAYSHDGGRLAFLSDAGGANQVWVMNSDGTNQRQVTSYFGPGEIRFAAWASGDRDLILSVDTGSESWLMQTPVLGDEPPEITVAAAGYATAAVGSLAYVTQPSGEYRSSVITVDDTFAGTISDLPATGAPADAPNFSADGAWIAYQVGEPGNRYIEITPLSGGTPRAIVVGFDASNPVWSPDGQAVAFVARNGQQPGIWLQSTAGGQPTALPLPGFESVWYLSWRR